MASSWRSLSGSPSTIFPLGLVIQTALPSQIRAKVVSILEPTELGVDTLASGFDDAHALMVLREIVARPGLTRRGMLRKLDGELDKDEVTRAIETLIKRAFAVWSEREVRESKGQVKTVTLTIDASEALERMPRAGRRMRAIVAALSAQEGPMDLGQLVADQGQSVRDALRRLESLGVVCFGQREVRDPLANAPALGPTHALTLNQHQKEALDALTAPDAKGAYCLYGVTGAGKTEVFLGAAEHTMARGKQVLVLVPEIGLTPQLVGRFRARFGPDVAVLHSGLTGTERLAQWRRIRAGRPRSRWCTLCYFCTVYLSGTHCGG